MHVLVTADSLSGSWTYARELVTGLVTRGVRVTLVSFGLLFDAIYAVKEGAPVQFHPSAAEFPVCPQKEMIAEDGVLEFIEHSLAQQAKVGHELFPLARI